MANPKIEVEVGAKINEFERKFKDVEGQLESTGKQFNKLNEFAVGALQGIAAAFTVDAIVSFGKAVLETTAKFQKFEAVLSNTLGSNSAAQTALIQISEFASKTPFAVDELTNAFVKLANQGFKPTTNELRSLGDLAASTGKSFDQLAEAIIDAQVGEFERLKEFGIRASKEGDNVKFTFKGVETQVKNTETAIRGYILSLGDAEGVSGAMAGISETLGGKISNLGDNIEQLKLAIGNKTSGVFAASLDWLNSFIAQATLAAKTTADLKKEADLLNQSFGLSSTRSEVDQLIESLSGQLSKQDAINRAIDLTAESYRKLAGTDTVGSLALLDQLDDLEKYREELLKASKTTNNLTDEEKKRAEESAKFYKQAIELSTQYNDKILAELSSTKLSLESGKKLVELSEELSKSIQKQNKVGIKDVNVDTSGFVPTDIIPDFDDSAISDFFSKLKEVENEFKAYGGRLNEAAIDFTLQLKDTIQNNLFGAFVSVGDAIGQAFAKGENILSAIGNSLLDSIANFLGDFGQQLIAFGVAGIAFGSLLEAIKKGGPLSIPAGIGAIAAGTALIAISSAIKSRASQGLDGGGSSIGTSGVGGGGGSSFVGGGIGGFLNLDREIQLVSVVRGNDIVLVSERAMDRVNKG
jgi:hypothetical protein